MNIAAKVSVAKSVPAAVALRIRNIQFNRDPSRHPRWWHGGNPIATAYFNALSAVFPEGEKFFMDSVRNYRDQVTPDLKKEIKGFVGQEAVHSREHAAFNALASDAGYDVDRLEQRALNVLRYPRSLPKIVQLAATVSLEHFTAILAHALLASDSRDLDGAPEDAKRLWSWHAMEEIEHKAVAFDVMEHVTRNWPKAARYGLRVGTMMQTSALLLYAIGANMGSLYKEDGINTPKTWAKTLHYLLVHPGSLRRIAIPYLKYYKPGFHPWDEDDRELLAETERRYELAA